MAAPKIHTIVWCLLMLVVSGKPVIHVHRQDQESSDLATKLLENAIDTMKSTEKGEETLKKRPSIWQSPQSEASHRGRRLRKKGASKTRLDEEKADEPEPLQVLRTKKGHMVRSFGPLEGKRKAEMILSMHDQAHSTQ